MVIFLQIARDCNTWVTAVETKQYLFYSATINMRNTQKMIGTYVMYVV